MSEHALSPRECPLGIHHPDLYLWDAWSCQVDGDIHLFCLALPRVDGLGNIINPDNRNDYSFHVHHFASSDRGLNWRDLGIFQQPGQSPDGHDSYNIWSGSIWRETNNQLWVGYTGIQHAGIDRPFIQNLALTKATQSSCSAESGWLVSSPLRDHDAIIRAGYFIDDPERLGAAQGECGGTILAWRDPFLFGLNDAHYVVFAAKATPHKPAVGLARVDLNHPESGLDLKSPITLGDDDQFTQIEVPKIYALPGDEQLLMVCATTNRISEDQPATEVEMLIRLYVSPTVEGPWLPCGTQTSVLGDTEHLFGATVIDIDADSGQIHFMAPFTTGAGDRDRLTFAPRFSVALADIGRVPQICAQR